MANGSRPNVLEDSCGLRNVQNLPEEQRAALSDDQRSALRWHKEAFGRERRAVFRHAVSVSRCVPCHCGNCSLSPKLQ